jgi:nucleoside-diphosphate-sugar epimerase
MAFETVGFRSKKILITGATGLVARPLVRAYSKDGTVFAMARYGRAEDRHAMEGLGAIPIAVDLARRESLSAIPEDIDYVINCAVARSGNFDLDFRANADGAGFLMARCRRARAFLHVSSTAVYEYRGHEPRKESDPLGDNHRAMFPTYSLSKIAAERVCMFAAREFGIPTTIARLCVPYGDHGGWPYFHLIMMRNGAPIEVHPERPNYYNLLHIEDCIEKIPHLLAAATPEVTLTNFAGSPQVSIEEWCGFMGELTGLQPRYIESPSAFGSLCTDLTRMRELVGDTRVDWREGIRGMIAALAPELLRPELSRSSG